MGKRVLKAVEAIVLLLVLTCAPLGAMGQGNKNRGRGRLPGTPRGPINRNANTTNTTNTETGNTNTNVNTNTHTNRRNRHPGTPRRVKRGRNTTPGTPRGPINSNR